MNTKQILLFTSDSDLSELTRISALTLTKLNCQVTLDIVDDLNTALEKSKSDNLHLIILDYNFNSENTDIKNLIKEIRMDSLSGNKKIIVVYSGDIKRDDIFKAGCDSIMEKSEFKRVVNNILVF